MSASLRENNIIPFYKFEKDLGVSIKCVLTWNEHILSATSKILRYTWFSGVYKCS